MTEEIWVLVDYRLRQADEALESAIADREANRLGSAVNRAYYAMFYAALALLASRQTGTSKHAAVIARVSQLFIKDGPMPVRLGRIFNQAFDLRQKSDYRELFTCSPQQADELIAGANQFVTEARQILHRD